MLGYIAFRFVYTIPCFCLYKKLPICVRFHSTPNTHTLPLHPPYTHTQQRQCVYNVRRERERERERHTHTRLNVRCSLRSDHGTLA